MKDTPSLIQRIKSSSFVRRASVLTIGTIVAQGIALAVTPILSRIFTPSDYGLLALFGAVSAVTATLVTLSYPIRIVLPKSDSEAKQVSLVAIFASLCLGSALILLSYILPGSIINAVGLRPLGTLLPVAIIAGIMAAIITIVTYWLNRKLQYKRIASLRIIQATLSAGFGLVMGLLSIERGLIYAQFFAILAGLVFFVVLGSLRYAKQDVFGLMVIVEKHKAAPKHLYPTAFLDVFTSQLPIFITTQWFAEDMAGHYRMAYTLLGLPAGLIGSAVAQVFYQRFSELWPDAVAAKKLLEKTWMALALLGFLPFLIVMIGGETIFTFVLGSSWGVAGNFASILAVMFFFSLLHSPTSTTLISMGLEYQLPFFGVAALVHRPLAFYIGYLQESLYVGLILFVILEIAHMLTFQFLVFRKINRIIFLNKDNR